MRGRKRKVEAAGENIFADLGLADAEGQLLKAQIVAEIYRLVRARRLTQAAAGRRMGISQPEVSRMFRGHFREYSLDRLMRLLARFDRDVEISSRPHRGKRTGGRIVFKAA